MKALFLTAATALLAGSAMANNITVSGIGLTGQDAAANTSQITFNVAWENSWRTSTNESNMDGAWMFAKYRKVNTSNWQHCTLAYGNGTATSAGHIQPAGSEIRTPSDGKGVWIYRAANGTGDVTYNAGQLRWNYGIDGLQDNDSVEIRLFAVEMVYVPQGPFYLGSGGTETGAFRQGTTTGTTVAPYLVTSEASITVGNTTNALFYTAISSFPNFTGDATGPIPATYPKGFDTFWVMKYECSQQQYADYLNCLDAASANTRNAASFPGSANAYVPPFPTRAFGGNDDVDLLAYLDWASMRPLTELEYEKASRGAANVPIANEYAWGNTTIVNTSTVLIDPTTESEYAPGFNVVYNSTLGRPLRNGGFASDTTTTRTKTGGSFYGAMEMSGNLDELVVTAGSTTGRAYTGLHGDGVLSGTATANVTAWNPAMLGTRGGSYGSAAAFLPVSMRSYSTPGGLGRSGTYGIRGARTAQ